jgi:hypothetical protein
MRRKTSIGVVGRIRASTGEKCGGVAAREERNNLDASSRSMSAKRMTMKRRILAKRLGRKLNRISMLGVNVVKNWDIVLISVIGILILRLKVLI